ncbi:MAG: sel1 repeat family protein [Methylococcales bacterium]|nr:sel1 repeat family protein [Methylococcales bacterium]
MLKAIKVIFISMLLSVSMTVLAETTEEIKELAKQGDALGQAKLASLHILGRNGEELDYKLAAKWMLKAAEQDLVEAQATIAAMYDRGMGLKGNRDMATQWYEKAANQGHTTSLAILGRNPTAKGSVKFSYQGMRLNASRSIPKEYAKRFLKK